jgi:acetate kinase
LRVLVVNAGSSSLKLRLLDGDDTVIASSDLPPAAGAPASDDLARALADWPAPEAVGHRIVHGGDRFRGPVRLDREVEAALRELTALAPLHQPKSLAALDAATALLPDVRAVACFDTAFHAGLPPAAATYALPAAWRRRYRLRRFGFHGLSHGYASRRAAELLGRGNLRLVSCHLGAGASLAAVRGGRSIDTTMGFTPLEGLVMATRSGSVDPGMLLWLLEREGLTVGELAEALEREAGLKGLAGDGDMVEVLAAAERGEAAAVLARDVYLHRLRGLIGSMSVSLGGLDALLFTGGVGENSAEIRRRAADGLAFLGVEIDPEQNRAAGGDRAISSSASRVAVLVVAAREDAEIARQARAVLGGD